jgi:hypothetical protein
MSDAKTDAPVSAEQRVLELEVKVKKLQEQLEELTFMKNFTFVIYTDSKEWKIEANCSTEEEKSLFNKCETSIQNKIREVVNEKVLKSELINDSLRAELEAMDMGAKDFGKWREFVANNFRNEYGAWNKVGFLSAVLKDFYIVEIIGNGVPNPKDYDVESCQIRCRVIGDHPGYQITFRSRPHGRLVGNVVAFQVLYHIRVN